MATSAPVNVLFVEDEPMVVELVAPELAAGGFVVFAVANAAEALKYLASDAEVDILLTDVILPGGMDGGELAARARALRPELPVVYTSGKATAADVPAVSRSVFVPKPFNVHELRTLLTRLTQRLH